MMSVAQPTWRYNSCATRRLMPFTKVSAMLLTVSWFMGLFP